MRRFRYQRHRMSLAVSHAHSAGIRKKESEPAKLGSEKSITAVP